MPTHPRFAAATLTMALLLPQAALAQNTQPYDGFLCCSMLVYRGWMDDQNYDDGHKQIVPAGTPLKFTGFGRWRLRVELDGKKQELGNQYSRTMSMDEFAARYVTTQDPKLTMQAWAPKVREAILNRKVMRGMTREQVVMALGYPPTSYTPDMDKPLWHYQFRAGEFQIFWTDDGRVDRLFGPPEARARVFVE